MQPPSPPFVPPFLPPQGPAVVSFSRGDVYPSLPPSPPRVSEDPSCPCVDMRDAFASSFNIASAPTASYLHEQLEIDCRPGDITGSPIGSYGLEETTTYCYPAGYGSNGCQAYDASGHAPPHACGGTSPPSWCSWSWCYVDKQTCRTSEMDLQGSLQFVGLQGTLYWSYLTCPQEHDVNDVRAAASYANNIAGLGTGQTIQVGMPAMDYPTHFKRNSSGAVVTGIDDELYYDDSVPWEGSIVDFMDAILEVSPYAGFNYTYATPSSRLAYPDSKWTATVYDVSTHVLDMGGSDFWVTAERAGITAFSAGFSVDLHYLWVPRPQKDDSFMNEASKVFVPFSNGLWALLFIVTISMSLVEVYLFRDQWRNDGYDEWKEAEGWMAKTRVVLGEWWIYLGRSSMHITAGFPDEGSTEAQTIAWIGWAFLILIAISAYTANLAAFMLTPSVGSYVDSMESAISDNKAICVASAVLDDVQTRYPDAYLVAMPYMWDNLEVDSIWETCDAIVWSLDIVKRDPTVAQFFCDLDVVAVEVVAEIPWAFPASYSLAPSLTYWITSLAAEGITYTDTFEDPYYSETCDDIPRLLQVKEGAFGEGDDRRRRSRRLDGRSGSSGSDDDVAERGRGRGGGGAAAGAARQQHRRRLKQSKSRRRRGRRGRRLRGSSGGSSAAGGSMGGDEDEEVTWLDAGSGQVSELSRLPASAFGGVVLIWGIFCILAVLRSLYDQDQEEGLTKKRREKRLTQKTAKQLQQATKLSVIRQGTRTKSAFGAAAQAMQATPPPVKNSARSFYAGEEPRQTSSALAAVATHPTTERRRVHERAPMTGPPNSAEKGPIREGGARGYA